MSILKIGNTGPEVEKLTTYLVKVKLLSTVADVFDKQVQNAVKQFQAAHTDSRDHPLVPDGIVGPLTWWALEHDDITDYIKPTVLEQQAPAQLDSNNFGSLVVSFALKEIELGAKEIGENNAGPFVSKYHNGLGNPGDAWCAAFVSYCIKSAAESLGIPMPYRYSLGAKDVYLQFQKKGWAYKASDDNAPQPGDIVVWHRGDPRAWTGHIGLVHHYDGGIVYVIEGNRGSFPAPVRIFSYVLNNIANLYGFGRIQI